jgi:ribose transport system ATP-binding protein
MSVGGQRDSHGNRMSEISSPLLEVRGLVKDYPGVRALGGVDLTVNSGQVHCLIGQNGAGKSTLIKCVSGLVEPTAGEVRFQGEPLPIGDPNASIARGIATIYQELDLVPHLSVALNVFLGHEQKRGPLLHRAAMHRETEALLARLGDEGISPTAPVTTLRPAQQQLVSMARALSHSVKLLILDEPSAVLDDVEVDALFDVVRRLTAEGVGIIWISHRLGEVAELGDVVTVLKEGRTVATELPPDTPVDTLIRHMVGGRLEALFPDRRPSGEATVLEVKGLSRHPDVHDASFELHEGEILGLGGLVGSGRTELLRAVYGLDPAQSGEVRVAGRRLPPGRPDLAIRAGLGFAPEERKSEGLWLDWSLIRNTTIADLSRFRRGPFTDRASERREASRHLRMLNTQPDAPERPARQFSGGNQQKAVLARWLLRSCKVLLLDEPTRGVDVGARSEIYRVIAELAANGIGIAMVSSELAELLGFCHRVLVLREGHIVDELDGATSTEEDILRSAVPVHHTTKAG